MISMMRLAHRNPIGRTLGGVISREQGDEPRVRRADGAHGTERGAGEHSEKIQVARAGPRAVDAQLADELRDMSADVVGLPTTAA